MTKIYKATTVKNRGLFLRPLAKKLTFLLIGMIGVLSCVEAQVTVLPATPYTTLKAAFDAINAGTHTGAITINITGNTTEAATAVLNSSGTGSANYTSVLIRPTATATITGALSTSIIELFGADNVTIDGLNGGNQLTITNTSGSTSSAVVWLGSASTTDGASNNTIKNCIIRGNSTTTTNIGIASSSGATVGGLAEGPNNNNTYQGNTINTCEIGISIVGPTSNETGNVVTGNSIGSVTAGNKLGHKGISVFQQQNILITQNTIFGLTSSQASVTFQTTGIYVGGTIVNGLIERNKISDVKIQGIWGCNGIQLESTSSSTNLTIANNFIWDVASGGFSDANSIDDGGFGIAVSKGAGYNIYYNSIDMSTNMTGSTTDPSLAISVAFWISGDILTGTINVKNNIFSNRQTTGKRYSIFSNVTNPVFATIDNNDYFSTNLIGSLAIDAATLASWQGLSGQDVNSLAVDPAYTSTSDLHLLGSSPLDGFAAVIAGITIDIDGTTRNATTPDIGADEFTPPNCSSNVAGTATATSLGICASGTATLSATGFAYGNGISYQWEYFSGSWLPLAGQTNPNAGSIGTISSTTQYRLRVSCANCCGGAGSYQYSNVVTITVNNPTVSGTTPGTRCGIGTVNLAATAAAGSIYWYAASTGGTPLFTGSPFTTPVISNTTTFYASNSIVSSSGFVGATYSGSSNLGTAVGFEGIAIATTLPNINVNSVDIPFTGTGTFTISLVDITNSILYQSYTTGTVTGSGTTAVTVPVSINIANAGNYLLIVDAVTGTINNLGYLDPGTYPYTGLGGAFSVTSGYFFGADPANMYLFNLNVSNICEGLRTPVVATVTAPPVFTTVSPAAGPGRTICSGSCVTLNVTSANGGYVYTWNPGSLAGASHSVCPASTTTYILTANDGTCRRDSAVTITVFTTPSALTVNPATATSCTGTLIPITATGGQLINQTAFLENFETFPLTQMTLTGTGVVANQNTTYYQQGTSSIQLTHSNFSDGQLAMTNSINLTSYTSPKLYFSHICALEPNFDFGYIQYSTDGGTVWNNFAVGDYLGTGTLIGGQFRFDKTSYSDWDLQFTGSGSTPGTGPATSLWKQETVNLAPYVAYSNFKVRFRLTSDVNTIYNGWYIDNVSITGNSQAPISWSPVTNLYLANGYTAASSAGTTVTCTSTTGLLVGMPVIVYTGTGTFQAGTTIASIVNGTQFTVNLVPSVALSGATVLAGYIPAVPTATQVWSIPTGNITYTATAANGSCTSTATSAITISAVAAGVTIAATGGTTICQGSPVTFTATVTNGGGNPGFKWFVNGPGNQVNPPLGYNPNPGNNPFTINGLVNGDVVTCQILSNAGGCVVPNNPTSAGLTMTVNPKPSVSINGPLSVCFPSILTLSTTGTIAGYDWYLGGSTTGVVTPTYNAVGPGTYSCIVTSNQGCKDTSADKILTQQTYTITATATNGSISPSGAVVVNCGANQSFTYTANPGGYIVCDVIIDGSSVGTPASPYVFSNVTANHTIDVVFCIPGCATPSTANAGTDAAICANANYTITGASISGPPGLTATWSSPTGGTFLPGTAFGVATSYTPSATDITNGTVDLTLTTNNPLGAPCAPASATMTLTIKPIPAITVTGNLGICSVGTTTTTLTANATIASGTISGYQWYNSVPTLIGSLPAQTISAAGNYSVKANASNGCSNTSPVTIIAFTSPSIPTITGSNTICLGTTSALTANVASPGNGGATIPGTGYQWYNPASIVGATNTVYTAAAPATYTVTVTNSNGCLSGASAGFAVAYDNSPLNGAYTIGVGPASCTNYISFATAISDLNTRGVGGNVRFDIPVGYSETVPSPGLALGSVTLNASVAGRTISFNKSGVGANPVLNAYVGTSTPGSVIPDGIWSLRGVDNVSINNIDLVDGNTTNPATMDYGFGLFKLSATDGAQNNTIQNCNITLKRVNDASGSLAVPLSDGSTGILVASATATAANALITPTAASGTNSNNKFYSNTIQNCNTGIALMGYAATTPFTLGDTGNDIGGVASGTGNNILNYGGAVASTAIAVGVRANNQWGLNISYNTINNNNGAGVNHPNNLRGIWGQAGTSANVTINNNNITLKSAATGAQQCTAIDNAIGATAASNTVSISNNSITGTYTTAVSGNMTGIINTANATNVNINGNTVDSYSLPGSGNWVGIQHNVSGALNLNMNNNTIQNCNITSTGTIFSLSNNGTVSTAISMSGNTITGITKAITATVNWISSSSGLSAATTALFNDNVITNNTLTAGGAAATMNCITAGLCSYMLDNNYIYNNSITGISTGVGTINGYTNTAGPTSEALTNNVIRKLFITGTSTSLHVIQGLNTNTAAASVKNISNNTIANLYCSSTLSASIYAIRSATGTTANIYRNKIDSLFPGQSATAGSIAVAIRTQTHTTTNIYNNFINLDLTQATAPAADAKLTGSDNLKGLEITDAVAGHAVNLYYNTIRLAGSGSGTVFGSTGISIFSTNPTVDIRNNIIVNLTNPGGATTTPVGYAVAYRRPAAVSATYATTSNNNLFYAGTPSATHLLYYDLTTTAGGNGYQTLATYAAGVGGGRESVSVGNVLPNFINPVSNLHLIPGSNCSTDGGAQVIAGYAGDYDTDVRSATTPDIGADEFAGTGVGVGVWKGVNTDWTDIQNWCDAVPDSKTNVTIPAGAANYPLITTATPICNNISIAANASVTITGAGKLGVYGAMANAGTFNVVDGTIEMLSSTAQTIPASIFQNNDLKNLIISNSAASPGVTLGGALNLYGKLSYTGSNRTFTTAGFLTLRSTATGTASLGDITNGGINSGNTITGDVSVERFASARRAWRFLSVPTQNNLQTIHEAWQENQATNVALPPGYGISMSKDTANAVAYGYDMQTTAGGSLKTFVPATSGWKPVTSTINVPGVSNGKFVTGTAYMVFVRGDRTINTFGPPPNTTVLRDKGALVTGSFAAPAIGAGQFAAIGNPYASAIDFSKLTKSGLQDIYYIYDPQLGTLGTFQTFLGPGPIYTPVLPGGSYNSGNYYIESGQAFVVHSAGPAGTLSFGENSKVDGSNLVARTLGTAKQLRTLLYTIDSTSRTLYDGVLSQFDGTYSNAVDDLDALKLSNFGENISIKHGDKLLSAERMAELTESDTIFYNLGNSRVKNYQFEFIPENIDQPGLSGFLEDNYLHTSTPVSLSLTTTVDFEVVNDAGSYAPDRFRLVFKQLGPVPVTFTSVRANKQNKNILVEWKVDNELNIHHYDVEKSADGHSFSKVHEEAARGNNGAGSIQYSWLDTNPWDGDNFYRIRSVGTSSDAKLSQVVKVNMEKLPSAITVFPNPVREDGILYISLDNKPAGDYQVSIVNTAGQTISRKTLNHAGGNSVYTITLNKYVAHGNYMINISGNDNVNLTFKVVY